MSKEPKIIGFGRTATEQNALDEYMLGFISRDELVKRLDELAAARKIIPEGSCGSGARK